MLPLRSEPHDCAQVLQFLSPGCSLHTFVFSSSLICILFTEGSEGFISWIREEDPVHSIYSCLLVQKHKGQNMWSVGQRGERTSVHAKQQQARCFRSVSIGATVLSTGKHLEYYISTLSALKGEGGITVTSDTCRVRALHVCRFSPSSSPLLCIPAGEGLHVLTRQPSLHTQPG